MKKLFTMLLILLLSVSMFGCTKENEGGNEGGSDERQKKTVLITDTMAGDFDQVVWNGFEMLKKDGWDVKLVEAKEAAEYQEDLYALCEEGYELIFIKADAISTVLQDVADDLHAKYPKAYFILVDSYFEHNMDFATAVPVDPYESSFIGGVVAALTSKTHKIAWIGHLQTVNLERFRNGFIAGAQLADPNCEVFSYWTGDWGDPIKGQETTYLVHKEHPDVDVIDHAAYIAGNGVITACEELGIPCIGCDTDQGDKGSTVFWSTLKSVDLMVYNVAKRWLNKEEGSFGKKMSFNIKAGSVPYTEGDYNDLPEEVKVKLDEIMKGIKEGTIDVFANGFEEFKLDY